MRPQHAIMSCFLLQALAFGAWLPRIPEVQDRLGLGTGDLAIALLGLPLGLLVTMPFAGPIVARLGGRTTIVASFPAFLAAISLPALSTHMLMLFAALFLCGIAMSMIELGMNIVADEVERARGVNIMSRCHGFWSLGMTAGSLLSVGLASVGVPAHWAIMLIAAGVLPLALLVCRALPPSTAHAPQQREGKVSG
ncbi:MAG TPA: MFS transporter, partial [Devosia sp.]|nr:MFS transporter [Devosia sp.]